MFKADKGEAPGCGGTCARDPARQESGIRVGRRTCMKQRMMHGPDVGEKFVRACVQLRVFVFLCRNQKIREKGPLRDRKSHFLFLDQAKGASDHCDLIRVYSNPAPIRVDQYLMIQGHDFSKRICLRSYCKLQADFSDIDADRPLTALENCGDAALKSRRRALSLYVIFEVYETCSESRMRNRRSYCGFHKDHPKISTGPHGGPASSCIMQAPWS